MSDVPSGPPSDAWGTPSAPPPPPPLAGGGFQPPPPHPYGQPPSYSPAPGYQDPGYGQPPAGYQGYQPAAGTYASWGLRVGATLLDGVFQFVAFLPAIILLAADVAALGVILYVAAAFIGFYFAYLTGATGQSPAKRLMGIKVVNETTGQPIGGGMGIARSFIHIIDALPLYLGFLWPLWDPKRQTFTDKVLGTVVYEGVPKQSFGVDLFKK